MSSQVRCDVCGATDYEIISGFYFCRNCNTQSQDIQQDQSFEYGIDAPYVVGAEEDREEIISRKIDAERNLTSWECYNLVLSGLVDELIELGAQSRLRKTAFQLWVLYLQTEKIAFFSKTEEKLPCLPIRFKNKDIEILYGIKRFRRVYLQDVKRMRFNKFDPKKRKKVEASDSNETDVNDADTSRSHSQKLLHRQRNLERKSLGNTSLLQGNRREFPTNLEELDSSRINQNSEKEVGILFRKSAREWMDNLKKEFEKIKKKYGNDIQKIPSNLRCYYENQIYCKYKSALQPIRIPLSVNLLLLIIRLALLLIKDSIQWADLLRWAFEGRLSCFRVNRFLPENSNIKYTDLNLGSRFNLIHHEMQRLTTFLCIKDIPTPNIFSLIERYAYDLCLPGEFIEFTKKLVALFPPQMDYPYYNNRIFPDFECRAMSYILFTFKLLFSLDDATELKQSEFADSVNKYNEKKRIAELSPLFSWTDWTRFIECRKAVLSKYDFTMNRLNRSKMNTTNSVFFKHWEKMEPDLSELPSKNRIPSTLLTQLEMTAIRYGKKNVGNSDVEDVAIEFPASLTPFRTYCQYLIDVHRGLISERCYRILSTDFDSHSIRHLLDPEWASAVGKKCQMNVSHVFKPAVEEIKQFEKPIPNIPELSKSRIIPAHILTPVRILDDVKVKNIEKSSEEFYPDFKCFDLNSEKQDKKKSDFKLYYPSTNYWIFHDVLSRAHQRTFNKHSMSNLSASFLWLLRECSRIIRCETRDLYDELVGVEYAYTCLFGDSPEYSREAPFFYLANEW